MKKSKSIKSVILHNLKRNKTQLLTKLSRFQKEGDSRYVRRRLDRIFEILKERCFYEGNPKKVLSGADFYQKIELFMNYDKKHYTDEETYEMIAQVFKSLYMNFLLAFLEEDEYMPIPYIGKIKIKNVVRYSPFHRKEIKKYYGIVKLDPDLRKELNKIDKGQKIDLIKETLDTTEKILKEKIT